MTQNIMNVKIEENPDFVCAQHEERIIQLCLQAGCPNRFYCTKCDYEIHHHTLYKIENVISRKTQNKYLNFEEGIMSLLGTQLRKSQNKLEDMLKDIELNILEKFKQLKENIKLICDKKEDIFVKFFLHIQQLRKKYQEHLDNYYRKAFSKYSFEQFIKIYLELEYFYNQKLGLYQNIKEIRFKEQIIFQKQKDLINTSFDHLLQEFNTLQNNIQNQLNLMSLIKNQPLLPPPMFNPMNFQTQPMPYNNTNSSHQTPHMNNFSFNHSFPNLPNLPPLSHNILSSQQRPPMSNLPFSINPQHGNYFGHPPNLPIPPGMNFPGNIQNFLSAKAPPIFTLDHELNAVVDAKETFKKAGEIANAKQKNFLKEKDSVKSMKDITEEVIDKEIKSINLELAHSEKKPKETNAQVEITIQSEQIPDLQDIDSVGGGAKDQKKQDISFEIINHLELKELDQEHEPRHLNGVSIIKEPDDEQSAAFIKSGFLEKVEERHGQKVNESDMGIVVVSDRLSKKESSEAKEDGISVKSEVNDVRSKLRVRNVGLLIDPLEIKHFRRKRMKKEIKRRRRVKKEEEEEEADEEIAEIEEDEYSSSRECRKYRRGVRYTRSKSSSKNDHILALKRKKRAKIEAKRKYTPRSTCMVQKESSQELIKKLPDSNLKDLKVFRTQHKYIFWGGLCYLKNRKQLASTGKDGYIQIWDLVTYTAVAIFKAHSNFVFKLVYIPDKNWLISGGFDKKIKIWDAKNNFENINTSPSHECSVYAMEYIPTHNYLVSGGDDTVMRIWLLNEEFKLKGKKELESFIGSFTYSKSLNRLFIAFFNGNIGIFNVDKLSMDHKIEEAHLDRHFTHALYYDDKFDLLVSGSEDGFIKIWDANKDWRKVNEFVVKKVRNISVKSFVVLFEKDIIIEARGDQELRVRKISTKEILKSYTVHRNEEKGEAVIWLDDRKEFVTGFTDEIHIWPLNL